VGLSNGHVPLCRRTGHEAAATASDRRRLKGEVAAGVAGAAEMAGGSRIREW